MIDVIKEITESFYYAELWCLEGTELNDDSRLEAAAKVFARLHDSVAKVPPSLVRASEKLAAAAGPAKFEVAIEGEIVRVANQTFPNTAAEFLVALNATLQHAASASF